MSPPPPPSVSGLRRHSSSGIHTLRNSVVPLAVVRWPNPLQSSWIVTPSASVGVQNTRTSSVPSMRHGPNVMSPARLPVQ
jgi:hypothetical protein